MNLSLLNNRHVGRTCTICGTGPSLDRVGEITGPRIFIHRAAFSLPASRGQTYWLVMDDGWGQNVPGPWAQRLEALRDGTAGMIGVFRNPLLGGDRRLPAAPDGQNIVHFGIQRSADRERALGLSRYDVAQSGQLYERIGSAATAMHLAWYMGCEDVVLAGISGGSGNAARLSPFYAGCGRQDYTTAYRYAMRAADLLGLNVRTIN